MQKLILITGDLAAGKSTLAKKLSEKLNTLCFTKDVLKEILSDDIGFSNRQENKKLSIASISVMNHIFYQYAFLKQD
jgi:adenylylsulfate kinase-like enzyme